MVPLCQRCGSALPPEILDGHCPQCLLERSLLPSSGAAADPSASLPRNFGEYELLTELARGGMGVVYRARQRRLNRDVALKMILSGPFAGRTALARFRIEAQTAARLQHPNIVAIHEVGEAEEQPYFTMDLIDGQNLADRVRAGPLPAEEAARYTQEVAQGVQFAHEAGVLHRDLKPSNVLIDPFDRPRITDFGLAKHLTGEAGVTLTGQTIGSPQYMAPEQASSEHGNVSVLSDVYSLGALLYHLITGRAPFAAGTVAETLHQVLHLDPPAPRLLNPALPADLETICLKCLEKEPDRRYSTAGAVAEELGRFLAGKPISARPIAPLERAARWCRRRPAVAALVVTVGVLLITLAIGSFVAAWRIEIARRTAARAGERAARANVNLERANERLAEHVATLELQRAEEFFRAGDASAALAQLATILRSDPSNHIAAERLMSALVHRDLVLPLGPTLFHPGKVDSVEFSADGKWLLTVCGDGAARIWNVADRQSVAILRDDSPAVFARFSPDGLKVATAHSAGTAQIWNWRTGTRVTPPLRHQKLVYAVAFSPDGSRLVTGSEDRTAKVWSAQTGELLSTISTDGLVIRVAFHPDGTQILTALSDFTVRSWDAITGRSTGLRLSHRLWVNEIVFAPNDETIATASRDRTVRFWDAQTGAPLGVPLLHPDGLNSVAFSPDGRLLATGCTDNAARVWDTRLGTLRSQAVRHPEQVNAAAFHPDGRSLVTACVDGHAYFWDLQPAQALHEPMRHADQVKWIEFSPDGRFLISASEDNTAQIWTAQTRLPVGPPLRHGSHVQCARFNGDGRKVVTASADHSAIIWEVETGKQLAGPYRHSAGLWTAAFSPDGGRVVTASADRTARIWFLGSTNDAGPILRHTDEVYSAEFSHDGTRIVTASADYTARVWDATTGEPATKALTHIDRVVWAEFSPDGRRVATASLDNTARVWDAQSGRAITSPLRHARSVQMVHFSPDGHRVITASLDHSARIWDALTGEPLTPPLQHDDHVLSAGYSPDGLRVVTGCADGTARVWDATIGLALSEPLRHESAVRMVCFSGDGERIAASCRLPGTSVRIWDVPRFPVRNPSWLPDLAEAAAGVSIGPRATAYRLPRQTLTQLKRRLAEDAETNSFTQVAQWFFADRLTRAVAPFDPMPLSTYAKRRIEENTLAGLEEAIRLEPTNAVALTRLATLVWKADGGRTPRSSAEARLLARRALRFDPGQNEAREILERDAPVSIRAEK